jgi:hypothetical protein
MATAHIVDGKLAFMGSPGVVGLNPCVLDPSSVVFSVLATLELSTKNLLLSSPDVVPDPARLDRLRLGVELNGQWAAVSGSEFDAQAQVVRGTVASGGRYTIVQICSDGTVGRCP